MPETPRNFSAKDLAQWVKAGLITPEQMTAIQDHIAAHGPAVKVEAPAAEAPKRRLNLVNIAYYFGGFMILLAYTIFLGDAWTDLDYGARVAITLGTILVLGGLGYVLHQRNLRTPGGLLLFVAAGIVPLFINSVQRMAGLWPEQWLPRSQYYTFLPSTWIPLEVVTITITLVILWWIRFPLMTMLATFWTWYLGIHISMYATRAKYSWDLNDPEMILSILLGFAFMVLAYFLQKRTKGDFSGWLYLSGHLLSLIFFTTYALDPERQWLGVIYIIVYLGFIVCSVWLQRRMFLVFGAIGCYIYMGYLALEIFEGTLGIIFALAGVGLLIVLTAVGYPRLLRPWLEKLFRREQPLPPA